MGNQIRNEYEGSAYHVMAHGNQGQAMYVDDLVGESAVVDG
jgi:hypothetical protein